MTILTISILPACSKVMEKHVKEQLSSHLESNNLLYLHQSGFRCGHSTASLLMYCTDRWYKALNHRQYVAVLLLDVSKAFDTVNHSLFLSKLQHLGRSDSSLSWFHSYILNNRRLLVYLMFIPLLAFPCLVFRRVLFSVPLFSLLT